MYSLFDHFPDVEKLSILSIFRMEKDNRSRDKQKRRKDTTAEVCGVMNDVEVIAPRLFLVIKG